jgi:uncharacterized delta-60 repeat protein
VKRRSRGYERRVRRLLGTLVVAAIAAGTAGAAPGGLDPSFSGDGWVRTYDAQGGAKRYFPKGATGLALQPDGKVVAVSEIQDGNSQWLFGVYRWTASGALDPSFGSSGLVVHDLPGSFETPYAVALQADGKIVVGGEAMCPRSMCFGLVRYRSDGSVDTTFGEGGLVRTMFPQCGCTIHGLAVQRDGRIVAVGERFRYGDANDDWLIAVARYLPDGRRDTSFSRDGLLSLDPAYGDDSATAVALQSDGKIVVAGVVTHLYRTEADFAVVRLRRNGTLDRSFSRDGIATVNLAGKREDFARGLDLQRNGQIVVAGGSGIGVRAEDSRFAFVRLNRNGSLDRRFGRRLARPGPHGGSGRAVLVARDGRILVGGRVFDDSSHDASAWALTGLLPSGRPDRSFGAAGWARSDFGTGADWIGALAQQRDGKIVAAGEVYRDQALARYLER